MVTFDADGNPIEYLGLAPVPPQSGTSDTLTNMMTDSMQRAYCPSIAANYILFFGSDAVAGPWNLDLTRPHTVSVRYDAASQTVSGTFEASFWVGLDTVYSPWAKPVQFNKGTFNGRLHQY